MGQSHSTNATWGGWWVATTINTQVPLIGVYYYPAYYVNHGIDPKEDSTALWYNKIRDASKTPVAGWGTDTMVGEYSSQDASTLHKQIKAMKSAGIDFIVTDNTNGLYPITPVFAPYVKDGDGLGTNGLQSLFQLMPTLTNNEQMKISVSLGFEFWGQHSLCGYNWNSWDGWDQQYIRQQNAIALLSPYFHLDCYFKYLGKPLLLTYIDQGIDYPPKNRPLWHFNNLTLRNGITWGMTYAHWMGVGGNACAPFSYEFFDGINNKRFWGWGAGAEDVSGAWDTKSLPVDCEEMSIMPGTRMWTLPGAPVKISRKYGDQDYYVRSWKQVITAKPKIVLITDWNNWNEETAIEGCVGPNGWKDLNGNPTYDWYLQITKS